MEQIFAEDNNDGNDTHWRVRKRVNRRRHNSKPNQGKSESHLKKACFIHHLFPPEKGDEEGLHLKGLFNDDPGGTKCPGSTPVTTPQGSDEETPDGVVGATAVPGGGPTIPLKEVCEKLGRRDESKDDLNEDDLLFEEVDGNDMDVF